MPDNSAQDILQSLPALPEPAAPAMVVQWATHAFAQLGTPEDAAGQATFMPGLDRAYGVRVPDLRTLGKHVARTYKGDADFCRSVAMGCWPQGSREHRLLALFVLEATRPRLAPAALWELGTRWLEDVVTWEDCDQLCSTTLGVALAADPAYMDVLESWVTSDHLWTRRAALVSTAYLRRSKLAAATLHTLDARALAMAARLLTDEEPYIRKAVDWTVREVLRRHYDLAQGWLMAQAQVKPDRIARTTLKLSAKKLSQPDQAAFLKVLHQET